MEKEPEGLVIRILRDIQSTLADHSRMRADYTKRSEHLERRFDRIKRLEAML